MRVDDDEDDGCAEDSEDIDGMLDITLHHASNIHNICIYGNQDVYAKFSITQTQDAVYSTQPVRGGGKNPVFNQSLQILISKLHAVLKCELWMMSCEHNYLQDQLLGFVLVPLCDLMGMGKITADYSLTSTELFHTPAGIVCLSLSFYKRCSQPLLSDMMLSCVKLNGGRHGSAAYSHTVKENGNTPVDYNSIEFPDLQVASENQQLISMYMKIVSGDSNMDDVSNGGDAPQIENGVKSKPQGIDSAGLMPRGAKDSKFKFGKSSLQGDCQLSLNTGENNRCDSWSEAMAQDTLPPSSLSNGHQHDVQGKTVSLSADQMTNAKPSSISVCSNGLQSSPSPTSVSPSRVHSSSDGKVIGSGDGQEGVSSLTNLPLVSISLEPEVPVVQQQIVDMYMKSMQQFTDSLAKMKLPFNVDGDTPHESGSNADSNESHQGSQKNAIATSESLAKDGPRLFYGSRAFF
ncbi:hypothetical protein KP509_26G021800 [Ceratopteris richardii]|nr:hypothetical protein KP509_26G021800 [Ceratopteris richardii]